MDTKALLLFIVIALLAVMLLPVAGYAEEDGYVAPSVEPQRPWPAIAISAVFLCAVCGIAFKNSKRTHLD